MLIEFYAFYTFFYKIDSFDIIFQFVCFLVCMFFGGRYLQCAAFYLPLLVGCLVVRVTKYCQLKRKKSRFYSFVSGHIGFILLFVRIIQSFQVQVYKMKVFHFSSTLFTSKVWGLCQPNILGKGERIYLFWPKSTKEPCLPPFLTDYSCVYCVQNILNYIPVFIVNTLLF